MFRSNGRLWGCVGILTVLLTGCGSAYSLKGDEATYPQAVKLFQQHGCITCHGGNLQGGIGPDLRHVGSRMTVDQIVRQINDGGGPMPGYGPDNQAIMTESEIKTLSLWLAQKK